MRILYALLAGMLCAPAGAANWQPVPGVDALDLDNKEVRHDTDSILRNKHLASVWVLVNYPKTQVETKPWGEVVKYQSTLDRMLFQCGEDTFLLEATASYSGRNGEGAAVERLVLPPSRQKFRSLEGSQFLTKIKAAACGQGQ
jgi:hypothetical protein